MDLLASDSRRVAWLLTLLALVDIVGEFVAQGTLAINITVSFLTAIAVLVTTRIGYHRPADV